MGGWLALLGYELTVKERLRESIPPSSPPLPRTPFCLPYHLVDVKSSCTSPSPQVPQLLYLPEQWAGSLSVRESRAWLQASSPVWRAFSFYVSSAFSQAGQTCLLPRSLLPVSLFPCDRQAAISFMELGRPRECWFPGG